MGYQMVSILSSQIKRTGDLLLRGATDQISDYKTRFEAVRGVYEKLLKQIIVTDFDKKEAYETAVKFFGRDEVKFAAVDGTEYIRPLFDLIIFFGGSYASTGTVRFQPDSPPEVRYEEGLLQRGRGISSCVPIYSNEVPDIEPGMDESVSSKPLNEKNILDNSRIADWIMAFSEFYLAYKLIVDEGARIILMDRSLSGEHSALIRDTARRRQVERNSKLIGLEVNGTELEAWHLFYGRHRYINNGLNLPPARGDTLRYSILYALESMGPASLDVLCDAIGVREQDRRSRVEGLLEEMCRKDVAYIVRDGSTYSLSPKYRNCWENLKKLTIQIGDRMFLAQPAERSYNPLKVRKDGREEFLTTLDIAYLTLFCFYMILEECWKRNVLLLGITKDTAARDFRRQVITVCINEKILPADLPQEELDRIPNTDRMFLQAASLYSYKYLKPPWSLVEYDSCFKTIVPYLNRTGKPEYKPRYVSGAVQNRISTERLFLKSYIQLSQADHDPKLRSNVLLIDRLAYPGYDYGEGGHVSFMHEYSGAEENIDILFYRNKAVSNPIQNLVILMLGGMTSSSIPEAFGHNVPLLIADQTAKWHYGEVKKIIDSTGHWILSNHDLRSFVFYMSTFRERRAEIESVRRFAQ